MTADSSSEPLHVPAEWSPQSRLWTCWPSHPALWPGALLQSARNELTALVQALSSGTRCTVLAHGDEAQGSARAHLGEKAEVIPARFGDIWLRDTGPVFLSPTRCLRFDTNGWGGKYVYEFDDEVGDTVAALSEAEVERFHFVLEGGALEHDGQGGILTTRQCLLNANRNGWTEEEAEHALRRAFSAETIYWLNEGLRLDHTDGHIDNLARFVDTKTVVCQHGQGPDDPNATIYDKTSSDLKAMGFEVVKIPSPGAVRDDNGSIMPASHLNFVISNDTVAVPVYGTTSGNRAVRMLAELFPRHEVVGLRANALLTGGGSFHCITQQQPAEG